MRNGAGSGTGSGTFLVGASRCGPARDAATDAGLKLRRFTARPLDTRDDTGSGGAAGGSSTSVRIGRGSTPVSTSTTRDRASRSIHSRPGDAVGARADRPAHGAA